MTVQQWDPATVVAAPGRDVIDGWATQVAAIAKLADYIAATPFVPDAYRGHPAAVAAAILTGRELGVGPMASLQQIHVIKGKPSPSAQLMRGLVVRDGHHLRITEMTGTRCTMVGRRAGDSDELPVTWTMDMARAAGLLGNPSWKSYPRAMLLARATGELCRAKFADVIGGMTLTAEEAEDTPAAEEDGTTPTTRTVQRSRRRAAAPSSPDSVTAAPPPLPAPEPAIAPGPGVPEEPDWDASPLANAPAPPVDAENTPPPPAEDEEAPEDPPKPDDGHKPATGKQLALMFATLGELRRMEPRELRLRTVSGLLGRRLTTMSQVTRREATPLIDTLVRVREAADPEAELDALVNHGWARIGERDLAAAVDAEVDDTANSEVDTPWWTNTNPPLPGLPEENTQ